MSDEALTVDQINAMLGKSPFISFMNLTCTGIDLDAGPSISMTMPMRPEFERGPGSNQFHGGPIASFIDTVGDYALVVGLKAGVPTINFRVDYLRPAFGPSIRGTATVRRAGRTVGVVDIDVWDANDKLVAVGRGTYSITPG
ncbi:MAG: PaaI family thioesterase [Alphaproteobacteria bacterium]